jgi:succinate-semialdehyde dehydrogenase/glutarate-semialdehyde dehydrogenase
MIRTVNPATGEVLQTFTALTQTEVDNRIQRAADAARQYRNTTFEQRSAWLHKVADLLTAEREELGAMMTREMGKPIAAAIAEAEKCALVCRYYADNAQQMLANESVANDDKERGWIAFDPLGVVFAIMPWNFPFWQVFRFAAPALMAGNVGLLKHASNVPQCALAIEALIRRAGFPDDVFQTLLIGTDLVESVIADPRVAAVTLTGSEGAGRSVASLAGKYLKKSVVELGGSDPFIVMPSANLDQAVATGVQARIINNGQSCIAAKRFIVHTAIREQFETKFVERVKALKVGDPMDKNVDIGPLATEEILKTLHSQVEKSVQRGARLLIGGERVDRPGNYYLPTVLADIPANSPAEQEELFGPVAPIFEAKDIDDAIQIANATTFGLGAAAWTNVADEQYYFVRKVEAGTVTINGMVVSDPRYPFGGVKNSGYGRELSAFGIREFVNIKTVRIMASNDRSAREVTE